MRNVLAFTLVGLIIFVFNPFSDAGVYNPFKTGIQTKMEIDQVVTQIERQVKYDRESQEQQLSDIEFK